MIFRTVTCFTLMSLCFNALANTEEEVFVTGELLSTSVLELSNSVSVLDQKTIADREAKNLEDLLNLAPNVNFSAGASRGRFIQIRGIGERSQFVAPINPSVGVIVDGIDFTGIATGVTALDTQQVEVFRGPQGTLYGANALAGMINVVGNRPSDSFYAEFGAGAGNYGSYHTHATLSGPISDALKWRFAALKNESDGFIENTHLNTDDTNNIDELSLRNHFHYELGSTASLDLISFFIDVDNGYDAFSLDNTRETLSDEPGHDRQETLAHALHVNVNGLSFADLNTTLSIADSETEYGYDEDWSFREICAIDSECAFFQYSTTDNYVRENDNTSIDVRLVAKETAELQWAAGIYHRNQNVDLARTQKNNDPGPAPDFYSPIAAPSITRYLSDYKTQNTAVYGQINFRLVQNLNLMTGLRLEDFSAEFSDSDGAEFDPSESLWGGRITLEYTSKTDKLYYALVSRGYKSGGFNPDPSLDDEVKTFDTETMLNYELGTKGRWLEDRLQAQLALFYQQRDDVQVKQSLATPVDGAFEFTDFIDNAAEGSNYGIEAELVFAASDNLSLFGSFGILETEFQDFVNLSHVDRNTDTGEGYDMSGRQQAHAPRYQFFVGAEFQLSQPLTFRVEVEGKDEFYFSESHNQRSEAYSLLNARLEYKRDNFLVALWGKNLTDETVATRGFYFSNDFGNDPRKLYAPETYTQLGAPLTFGVSANIKL